MFLSSLDRIFNVEDEALLPFTRQRSLMRFAILLGTLALGAFLTFAAEPAPVKKKVVHSTPTAAKKAVAKAPVKAPVRAAAKAPVKSAAGVPRVVTRAQVKHTAASTQASATNQAIVARMNAGKKLPARSA